MTSGIGSNYTRYNVNRSAFTDDEFYVDLGKAGGAVFIAFLFVLAFLSNLVHFGK